MELKSFVRANLDRVIALVLALAGVLAIIIGWFGISGTGLAAEQLPYLISGGIGGIVLVALGCTAWVSADLQDEWRRLDAIEERLERLQELGQPRPTTDRDGAANGRADRPIRARGAEKSPA